MGAVWDALGKAAARDLVGMRRLCARLWPAFVAPVRAGELGAREFARLMVKARGLFQDEGCLADGLGGKAAGDGAEVRRRADNGELVPPTRYGGRMLPRYWAPLTDWL